MNCSVVIPVYNQLAYTIQCLDSLRQSGVPDSLIVVVNNGSTDGTAEFLARRLTLRVIHNPENRDCNFAWNQGVRANVSEWTVILNNDVVLPTQWLRGLLAFAEAQGCDIVSPAMCEGELDYNLQGHTDEFTARMAAVWRKGVAHGVCFMVHRHVFDTVGFFDDDPRTSGYADDEFFRRAGRAGFRLAVTGRSFIHHFGSVTQKSVKAERNMPLDASLGDREYYREKYGLTWFVRRKERLRNRIRSCWWRHSERLRFGMTLRAERRNGQFHYC